MGSFRHSLQAWLGALVMMGVLSADAAQNMSNFVYQVRVPAGNTTCETEAIQWGERFERATGAQVTLVKCQAEVSHPDYSSLQYTLVLKYQSDFFFQPYLAQLGKREHSSSLRQFEAFYSDYAACVSDIPQQVEHYERYTELVAVSAFCEKDDSILESRFYMQIEGFNKKPVARPAQYLYTFTPFKMGQWGEGEWQIIESSLQAEGKVLVKKNSSSFAYYGKSRSRISANYLVTLNSLNECEIQKPYVEQLYQKSEGGFVYAWCTTSSIDQLSGDVYLEVLHDRPYSMTVVPGMTDISYFSFDECLQTRDIVMSDVRYSGYLGALCAPNLMRTRYELHLVRQ